MTDDPKQKKNRIVNKDNMFFMAKKREKMGKEKIIVRALSCRGWLHAPYHHEEGGETHQIPP